MFRAGWINHVSCPENALSYLRKLFSVSMGIFLLTDLPCTLVAVLTGKGLHQVGRNLLWEMFLIKAIVSPKQNYPESLGSPQFCESVHDQVTFYSIVSPMALWCRWQSRDFFTCFPVSTSAPSAGPSLCWHHFLGVCRTITWIFFTKRFAPHSVLPVHPSWQLKKQPLLSVPSREHWYLLFPLCFLLSEVHTPQCPRKQLINAMVCLRGTSKLGIIRAFTRHQISAECAPNSTDKSAAAMTQFHLSPLLNLRQEHGIYYAGTCVPKREDVAIISSWQAIKKTSLSKWQASG